jgi:hypothetical protein
MPKEFQNSKGEEDIDLFVKPDMNQMIPFKPRRMPAPGSHPVNGGEFPMPQGNYAGCVPDKLLWFSPRRFTPDQSERDLVNLFKGRFNLPGENPKS